MLCRASSSALRSHVLLASNPNLQAVGTTALRLCHVTLTSELKRTKKSAKPQANAEHSRTQQQHILTSVARANKHHPAQRADDPNPPPTSSSSSSLSSRTIKENQTAHLEQLHKLWAENCPELALREIHVARSHNLPITDTWFRVAAPVFAHFGLFVPLFETFCAAFTAFPASNSANVAALLRVLTPIAAEKSLVAQHVTDLLETVATSLIPHDKRVATLPDKQVFWDSLPLTSEMIESWVSNTQSLEELANNGLPFPRIQITPDSPPANIVLTVPLFAAIVNFLVAADMPQQAIAWHIRARSVGVPNSGYGDRRVCIGLIHAYTDVVNGVAAVQILQEMVAQKMSPELPLFLRVMRVFLVSGRKVATTYVFKLFILLQNCGLQPDMQTLNILARCCPSLQTVHDVFQMARLKFNLQPDEQTYTNALLSLIQWNRWNDGVFDLIDEMNRLGFVIQKRELVHKVLRKLRRQGPYQDLSQSTIQALHFAEHSLPLLPTCSHQDAECCVQTVPLIIELAAASRNVSAAHKALEMAHSLRDDIAGPSVLLVRALTELRNAFPEDEVVQKRADQLLEALVACGTQVEHQTFP